MSHHPNNGPISFFNFCAFLHAPCSAHSIAQFPAWSTLAYLLLGGRVLEAVFIVPINLDSWNDGSCHGGPRGLFEPPTDPSTFNPSLPLAVVSQHSTLVPYDAYSHQLHDRAYTICDSAWRHPVLLCLRSLQYRASAHTVIPDSPHTSTINACQNLTPDIHQIRISSPSCSIHDPFIQ